MLKLFFNPCINEEVMAGQIRMDGRMHAQRMQIHRTDFVTTMSCFTASGPDKIASPALQFSIFSRRRCLDSHHAFSILLSSPPFSVVFDCSVLDFKFTGTNSIQSQISPKTYCGKKRQHKKTPSKTSPGTAR